MDKDWSEVAFDSNGEIDIDETRLSYRNSRNIPPNPPPRPVKGSRLDGKTLAAIAVNFLIDSGSWKNAAVMLFYIDCANRTNGFCYPSERTTAKALGFSERTVRRANRFWRTHGCSVNGFVLPLLDIAAPGRIRPDGKKESNAYDIGWLPLIAVVRDRYHFKPKTRRAAAAILRHLTEAKNEQVA
jgi:hypothetical protein